MIDQNTAIADLKRNLETHLEKYEWEAALGKVRALELVSQRDLDLERALLLIIDFMDALRAKNYVGATKTAREGWKEKLYIVLEGLDEALEALQQAEQNWRTSETAVRNALKKASQHILTRGEAENQMGVLEAIIENRDAARGHFQAALGADQRHYRAMTNLGNLELEAGNFAEAEMRYREVIRLNPDYSVVYNNLAAVMKKQGKRSESVTYLKKAQQLAVREVRGDTRGTNIGKIKNPALDWLGNPKARWGIAIAVLVIAFLISRR